MRLSDAIKMGAMLRPQAFGDYFNYTGSCAIGAACEAYGIDLRQHSAIAAFEMKHSSLMNGLACPACGTARYSVNTNVIVHLNDDHRWTREQIADWVATIEDAQQSGAQPDAVEVLAEA